MAVTVGGGPAASELAADGDSTVVQSDPVRAVAGQRRVGDDGPHRPVIGMLAHHPQIASKIDQNSGRPVAHDLSGHQVGPEPLADPAWVERQTLGQHDRRQVG